MSNISELIQKPKIDHRPQDLTPIYSEQSPIAQELVEVALPSNAESKAEVTQSYAVLTEEISSLSSEITSLMTDTSVTLAAGRAAVVGISEATLSDYLKSIGGSTTAASILQEDFEDANFDRGNYLTTLLGDLQWNSDALTRSLQMFSSELDYRMADNATASEAAIQSSSKLLSKVSQQTLTDGRCYTRNIRGALEQWKDLTSDSGKMQFRDDILSFVTHDQSGINAIRTRLTRLRKVLSTAKLLTKMKWKDWRQTLRGLQNTIIAEEHASVSRRLLRLEADALNPILKDLQSFVGGARGGGDSASPAQNLVTVIEDMVRPVAQTLIESFQTQQVGQQEIAKQSLQCFGLIQEASRLDSLIYSIDLVLMYLSNLPQTTSGLADTLDQIRSKRTDANAEHEEETVVDIEEDIPWPAPPPLPSNVYDRVP